MRISKDPLERRKELIDAAKELFIELGVSKTSIAKIAQEVGVAKGLFYYYFQTKDDVLKAVIDEMCDKHVAQLQTRLQQQGVDFYSRLLIFIDAYYDVHPDNHSEALFEKEFIQTFHYTYLVKVRAILDQIVAEGQECGLLKLKHPGEMVIMTLDGVFALMGFQEVSQTMLSEMIEQSLNFSSGSLADHSEKYLENFERS